MKHLLQKRCQTATMFFSKQECLKKGHAHFCADLCNSPQNGKPCFPETRNPVWGTSHQMISAKRGMQQSPKWQPMFPGNKKPRLRDIPSNDFHQKGHATVPKMANHVSRKQETPF
jgi:hypothetical protein